MAQTVVGPLYTGDIGVKVPSLDGTGKVPIGQLPVGTTNGSIAAGDAPAALLSSNPNFSAGASGVTPAYGDGSTKMATTQFVQDNAVSQFAGSPLKLDFSTSASIQPAPGLLEKALIVAQDTLQWYYLDRSQTATVAQSQTVAGIYVTVSGNLQDVLAPGDLIEGTGVPIGSRIVTAVNSGVNTDVRMTVASSAVLPITRSLTFARYKVQPNYSTSLVGVIPSANLPLASPTTPGVIKVDTNSPLTNDATVGLTCKTDGCPAVDGTTIAITGPSGAKKLSAIPAQAVCSNTGTLGDNGGAAGNYNTRRIFYCPAGATQIALFYSGFTTDGAVPPLESNLSTPVIRKISIATNVPRPWNPATAYATGDRVSFIPTTGGSGNTPYNPYFVAVGPSTGVYPTPSNTATWASDTPASPIPITCDGSDMCPQGTSITQTGVIQTKNLRTDTVPVSVPVDSFIEIRETDIIPNATTRLGHYQTARAGSYTKTNTGSADNTLAGNVLASNSGAYLGSAAILGRPINPVPCVVTIGDSILIGLAGYGVGGAGINAPGTGYAVGDIITMGRDGASSDNVYRDAKFIVQTVSGGTVTALGIFEPGHYGVPATGGDTVTALPQATGVSTTSTGSGTGLTVNPSFSNSPGTYEDIDTLATGDIGISLARSKVPVVTIARSSDRLATWVAQGGDKQRLAIAKASGCRNAIIELGYNDINAGTSSSVMLAQMTTLANQLIGLGIPNVWVSTIVVGTNSTNTFWTTTAGQGPLANAANRVAFNALIKPTPPAPFAGYVDRADKIEVNASNVLTTGGGYQIVDGTNHYCTLDGTHKNLPCQELMVPATSAIVSSLK